jgi:hypothetical protein
MNVRLLFFAMGLRNRQKPQLVCTSGSALLNYYPAIAEAFYSQIPLIVISADSHKVKLILATDKPSDKRMYSRIILCTMPI